MVFNPEETAENLRKYGGFLPGIRPGKRTAEYIDYVLTRLTVIGAAYIAAGLPAAGSVLGQARPARTIRRHLDPDRRLGDHGHGGPDPVHLLAHQYEGLIKKSQAAGGARAATRLTVGNR